MGVIRRHGWWLLALALTAVALVWPRLKSHDEVVPVVCPDIVAGCPLPHPNAHVRFNRPPEAMQRFNVYLAWPNTTQAHVSFKMRDMEMGLNRYRLLPDGQGKWQAELMLPACVQGRKDWLMLLDVDGNKLEIPFSTP